jgi:hypothetical protein
MRLPSTGSFNLRRSRRGLGRLCPESPLPLSASADVLPCIEGNPYLECILSKAARCLPGCLTGTIQACIECAGPAIQSCRNV